jgi:hypothetical protein
LALSAALDGKVRIWSADSGQTLQVVANPSGVNAAVFAHGGKHLGLGLDDGTFKVIDWRQNRIIWQCSAHQGFVSAIACSPDGTRIASGGADNVVRVWDYRSGTKLTELRGHDWWIKQVRFSLDGRRLLTGGFDGSIRVWDVNTGQELLVLEDRASVVGRPLEEQAVDALALSPDGTRIVSGDVGGLHVWEAASTDQVSRWLAAEDRAVRQRELADLERARRDSATAAALSNQEGVIGQWLILAPVPYQAGEPWKSGNIALDDQQVTNERHLTPTEGQELEVNDRLLQWRRISIEGHLLDFNSVLGTTSTYSVAYAVSYIRSDYPQTELLLKVGCDDQAKIYLNGEQLSLWRNNYGLDPGAHVIEEVTLREGINTLVFKVVNERGGWQGCVRITDRGGRPVRGISVSADPGDSASR